MERRWSLS
jgi:hypothetical protein